MTTLPSDLGPTFEINSPQGVVLVEPGQPDFQSRRKAVSLAFGRRPISREPAAVQMQSAAALVAETLHAPFSAATELLSDGSKLLLTLSSAAGLGEPGKTQAFSLAPTESLSAFALHLRHPVLVEDLAAEIRFRDRFLRQLGVTSALAVPLWAEDRPFGVIAIFSRHPRVLTVEDLEFTENIAQLLVASLARMQAEQDLRRERGTLATLLDSTDTLVLVTDLEGKIRRMNKACERVSGFAVHELLGRAIWSVLALPEEMELAQEMFKRAGEEVPLSFENRLSTKHSGRRWIRWSQMAMLGEGGAADSIVFTGTDLTRQKELQAELDQAKIKQQQMHADLQGVEPSAGKPSYEQLRSSPRRAYPYRQRIAPSLNGATPKESDFSEVQFSDISAGGASFVLDSKPEFDSVVLGLGFPPKVHYMTARVVNVNPIQRDGKAMFLVGCRFLDRVHVAS